MSEANTFESMKPMFKETYGTKVKALKKLKKSYSSGCASKMKKGK